MSSAGTQALEVGSIARISGLQRNVTLNGLPVGLHLWDTSNQRWVAVLPWGEHKSMKADNLDPMDGQSAIIAWAEFHAEAAEAAHSLQSHTTVSCTSEDFPQSVEQPESSSGDNCK